MRKTAAAKAGAILGISDPLFRLGLFGKEISKMEKLIDAVLVAVYVSLISMGGKYTLQHAFEWSQKAALQKAVQGLGRLEPATRKMTGGKLDF